jgi:hypothetical protein
MRHTMYAMHVWCMIYLQLHCDALAFVLQYGSSVSFEVTRRKDVLND